MNREQVEMGLKVGGAMKLGDLLAHVLAHRVVPAVGGDAAASQMASKALESQEGKALLLLGIGELSGLMGHEEIRKRAPNLAALMNALGPAATIAGVATGSSALATKLLTVILKELEEEGAKFLATLDGNVGQLASGVRFEDTPATAPPAEGAPADGSDALKRRAGDR